VDAAHGGRGQVDLVDGLGLEKTWAWSVRSSRACVRVTMLL
jgi:hypothetical protein